MNTILLAVLVIIVLLLIALVSLLLIAKFRPQALQSLLTSKLGQKLFGFILKSEKVRDKTFEVAAEQISADPESFKQVVDDQFNLGRKQTRMLDKQLENMDSEQLAQALKEAEQGKQINPQTLLAKPKTIDQQRAKAKKKSKQRAKAKAARKQRKKRR